MAKAFSPYLAVKAILLICVVQIGMLQILMITRAGLDRSKPNYDGINVYGDEVATNIRKRIGWFISGRITPAQYNVFRSILPNSS
jgi:hypothetical protein